MIRVFLRTITGRWGWDMKKGRMRNLNGVTSFFQAALVGIGLLSIIASGGGGGSSSVGNGTGLAAITADNAKELVLSTLDAAEVGGDLTDINQVGLDAVAASAVTTNGPGHLSTPMGRLAILVADIVMPTTDQAVHVPFVSVQVQDTIDGPCGTMVVDITYDNETGVIDPDSNLVFDGYGVCADSLLTGTIFLSGNLDRSNLEFEFNIDFTKLTISIGETPVLQMTGSMDMTVTVDGNETPTVETIDATFTLIAVDLTDNDKAYSITGFRILMGIDTDEGGDFVTADFLNGSFTHPDYGRVDIVPGECEQFKVYGEGGPVAGVLVILGANGSWAMLEFGQGDTYTVTYDTDGDGPNPEVVLGPFDWETGDPVTPG